VLTTVTDSARFSTWSGAFTVIVALAGDDDAVDRKRAKAGELKLHLVDAGRHQR
jgi:hypothetical protein